ncbi:hypothetical protein ACFP9W_06825 [Tatumella terrea]|uniref:Uncharacterized protein n=1 Tax=Tatumella terrea TaxID=419007 RepID=A0ABW1VYM8_9GAMM
MTAPSPARSRAIPAASLARSDRTFFSPEETGTILFILTDVMSVFLCPVKIKMKGMKE